MKKKYLITVAIPTYNRSDLLAKRLDELFKEKSKNFAVLIGDDRSTDDTEKIVKLYQKKMKNLYYIKNTKNLGYSRNVCQLYESSQSDYVWFLCDDDSVLPGAITSIESAIKKYSPVIAIFNSFWENPYGVRLEGGAKSDKLYTRVEDIIDYTVLMRTSFLSILLFRKIGGVKKIKETNFEDNVFFQITLALYFLTKQFRLVEVAKPIAERHVGYKYGEFLKFNIVDHLKAVYAVDHVFDNKQFIKWSIRQIPNNLLLYLCQKLGIYKFYGNPTKETRNYTKKFYGPYASFIFGFPIFGFIVPTIILKTVYLLRVVQFHGLKKGITVYKSNINRAFRDARKTTFIHYR